MPAVQERHVARYALIVLTAMNLLNYLDRYVPSAVKDLFKADLQMTDAETSLPLTAFVIVYMITSPIFGGLADKMSRTHLIAGGVALWSLATAAAAFATGFKTFFLARALVGVGEAAYATISPALLSDFYPPERRNRVLTIFYVAIPVGSALGFSIGGLLGEHYGWRTAFLACGAPGLLAAGLALRIRDPGRGALDTDKGEAVPAWGDALRRLARNPAYVVTVLGYTLVTFAAGALADWFPTFLSRERGLSVAEAGSMVGTMTVAGGLLGTVAGGFIAEKLQQRTRQPYLAVSGVSMVLATAFGWAAIHASERTAIAVMIFLTQFFLWFYNGPVNTLLVNCVPASMRARAFSLSILCIHLFGDAVSPPLVGLVSDATGSLGTAIMAVPVAMAAGALVWIYGWRKVQEA